MQAITILQAMYVRQMQRHLQEHKVKANKKKTKNWRFGDGYAKLLTGDKFYNMTIQIDEEAKQKEMEKQERVRRMGLHWQNGRRMKR